MTRPRRSYEYPDGAVLSLDGRLRFAVDTHVGARRLLTRPRVRRWRLCEVGVAGPYRDGEQQDEVWSRTEVATHPWPWCLYVHVDGTTAVLHADDSLRLYDPDGRFVAAVDVLAALQADPRSAAWISRTTAGPWWDAYPKGCFAALRGRLCFVVRAYWGARVIVDARTGERVAEAKAMADDLRAAEEAWALARLLRAVRDARELPFYSHYTRQDVRDVVAAAQLAGQLGLTATAPLLQRLRHTPPSAQFATYGEDSPYRPVAGELDIRSYTTSAGRLAVRLALQRLGEAPAVYPAYYFIEEGLHGHLFDPGPRPEGWARGLAGPLRGLQPRALLARVGAPSWVRGEAWDYDVLEADGPRTVRVTWGRRGVGEVRTVAPPEWVAGHARDALH